MSLGNDWITSLDPVILCLNKGSTRSAVSMSPISWGPFMILIIFKKKTSPFIQWISRTYRHHLPPPAQETAPRCFDGKPDTEQLLQRSCPRDLLRRGNRQLTRRWWVSLFSSTALLRFGFVLTVIFSNCTCSKLRHYGESAKGIVDPIILHPYHPDTDLHHTQRWREERETSACLPC